MKTEHTENWSQIFSTCRCWFEGVSVWSDPTVPIVCLESATGCYDVCRVIDWNGRMPKNEYLKCLIKAEVAGHRLLSQILPDSFYCGHLSTGFNIWHHSHRLCQRRLLKECCLRGQGCSAGLPCRPSAPPFLACPLTFLSASWHLSGRGSRSLCHWSGFITRERSS